MPPGAIADHIRERRSTDAQKLYAAALAHAREYASWATSGGEGMSRMGAVRELEAKLSVDRRPPLSTKATTSTTNARREEPTCFRSVGEAMTLPSSQLQQDNIEELFRTCAEPVE